MSDAILVILCFVLGCALSFALGYLTCMRRDIGRRLD